MGLVKKILSVKNVKQNVSELSNSAEAVWLWTEDETNRTSKELRAKSWV